MHDIYSDCMYVVGLIAGCRHSSPGIVHMYGPFCCSCFTRPAHIHNDCTSKTDIAYYGHVPIPCCSPTLAHANDMYISGTESQIYIPLSCRNSLTVGSQLKEYDDMRPKLPHPPRRPSQPILNPPLGCVHHDIIQFYLVLFSPDRRFVIIKPFLPPYFI